MENEQVFLAGGESGSGYSCQMAETQSDAFDGVASQGYLEHYRCVESEWNVEVVLGVGMYSRIGHYGSECGYVDAGVRVECVDHPA